MTRTEAKRLKLTKTLEEAHALADRALANVRAANKRKSGRPPRAAGTDKAQERLTKAMLDRIEYEAVVARDPTCTAGLDFGACSGHVTIDHQWGRGKAPTKRENCRKLCFHHHGMKTDGQPSRLAWLRDFRRHALQHRYADEAAKAERAIALEIAQHPERRCLYGALVCTHAQCQGETTP